jgi:hypothetical protein
MTIQSRMRLSIFFVLTIMGGCGENSVNPITPVELAQNDGALFGVWRATDRQHTMYVHVGPKDTLGKIDDSGVGRVADQHRTQIVIIEHSATGITQESYIAHVSRIGTQRFLNIQVPQKGNDPGGYVFVRYAVTGKNVLRASLINGKALDALIRAGEIKGVVKDGMLPEALITADSAEIPDFIERNHASLFAKPLVLKRVPENGSKR